MAKFMTDLAETMPMDNHETARPVVAETSEIQFLSHATGAMALVPTRYCLLTDVEIHAKKQKDLLAALPYALEEQLSEPVEELHFVPLALNEKENQYAVVVTSHERMMRWSETLGTQEVTLLPDVLMLPVAENSWTMVITDQRVLIRTGSSSGFESTLLTLKQSLELLSHELEAPQSINLWLPEGASAPQLPEWMAPVLHIQYYPDELYEWLSRAGQPERAFNLLCGMYSRKGNQATGFKVWLPSIILFACAFMTYLGLGWKQVVDVESDVEAYQNKTNALFASTFPDVKRIVNPRVQAEQEIAELANTLSITDTDFFPLFEDVMKTVHQSRAVNVNGFSWKNSILQLKTVSKTVSDVEQLKSKLSELDLQVEIINAVNRDGGYQAQLKIQERAR